MRAEAGADLAPDTRDRAYASRSTGRVMLKRDMGRLGFATLRDGSGDLQVMVDVADVGAEERRPSGGTTIDLGDHVGVTGEVITTHTGELSVLAESLQLTSKSLRPLPDKHKGLTDPEARVRAPLRRPDRPARGPRRSPTRARPSFAASATRCTPAASPRSRPRSCRLIHGGANARPFETHINAYDMDLYLRIATELHLKRLLVGGMEKVFEVGRQFRNEGVDFKHNPEFTSLEVYETYGDYDTMRVLTQELIQEAATAVYGSPVARRPDADGNVIEYDLSGDWPVKTICEAVSEALGEEVTADTPIEALLRHGERHRARARSRRRPGASCWRRSTASSARDSTTTPVFYTDFPKENAPLTRQHRRDPRLAEKWDLVIFGAEQGTAYSELIDPLDQRERLVSQSLLAAAGDPRPCRSTRTSSRPSSTACRRPAAWGWASTDW